MKVEVYTEEQISRMIGILETVQDLLEVEDHDILYDMIQDVVQELDAKEEDMEVQRDYWKQQFLDKDKELQEIMKRATFITSIDDIEYTSL